jgi:two-component system cell cycle sensor histidine kinase/response regulator CckA
MDKHGPLFKRPAQPDFRAMFESMPGFNLVLSPESRIIAASNACLQAANLTQVQIVELPLSDALPSWVTRSGPRAVKEIEASFRRVLNNRTQDATATLQSVLPQANGAENTYKEIYWKAVNSPVVSSNGEVLYIIVSVQDVTAETQSALQSAHESQSCNELRSQIEVLRTEISLQADHLRHSEERFAELLEGAPDAAMEIDAEGRVVRANSATVRMFGWTQEELLGQEVEALVVPGPRREAHREHRGKYAQHPRLRRMGIGLELSAQKKDGSVFPVEISLIPVWSRGKSNVIAMIHDITQRKKVEERILQAQKLEALGRLAGGTAHEFNNLLAVILGSAELILSSAASGEAITGYIDQIRTASTRAGGLSRQLLTFGRAQMISARVIDLNHTLSELANSQLNLGHGIECRTLMADAPVWTFADPLLLQQVITSLLVNAGNAMPDGGEITVSAERVDLRHPSGHINPGLNPGKYALLSVRDTGLGMTPEVQRHIFEPFFSTKPSFQATGMSLSAVYGIVMQSGGAITVQSQPGSGTTFMIYLPHPTQEQISQRHEHSVKVEEKSLRGTETIMLLDDQPDLLMLTAEFLRRNGYEVLPASRGDEALHIAAEFRKRIDLFITDIVMPEMNGRICAEKLKATRPGVPILYVSGYTDGVFDSAALASNEGFLAKPFTLEELGFKIREMLCKSHAAGVSAGR